MNVPLVIVPSLTLGATKREGAASTGLAGAVQQPVLYCTVLHGQHCGKQCHKGEVVRHLLKQHRFKLWPRGNLYIEMLGFELSLLAYFVPETL